MTVIHCLCRIIVGKRESENKNVSSDHYLQHLLETKAFPFEFARQAVEVDVVTYTIILLNINVTLLKLIIFWCHFNYEYITFSHVECQKLYIAKFFGERFLRFSSFTMDAS